MPGCCLAAFRCRDRFERLAEPHPCLFAHCGIGASRGVMNDHDSALPRRLSEEFVHGVADYGKACIARGYEDRPQPPEHPCRRLAHSCRRRSRVVRSPRDCPPELHGDRLGGRHHASGHRHPGERGPDTDCARPRIPRDVLVSPRRAVSDPRSFDSRSSSVTDSWEMAALARGQAGRHATRRARYSDGHRFITRVSVVEELARVTPATLDVLAVLVGAQEDLHGFAIAEQAGRPTGSIYPILDRLRRIGWLTSYWETAHPKEGRPRRRFYRLQPDGLQAARALLAERRAANPAILRQLRSATGGGAGP
jgi:PadR family transcriptional regulator, regulatory protein PadR